MHIAEGVLSPGVLCVGYCITGLGTFLGIRRLSSEQSLTCGILAAVFFLASLIHIPLGFTSAHLLGVGLVGVFLGLAAYPAIVSALFLQALFFQFGGITVLGVNAATMATAAVLAGLLFRSLRRLHPTPKGTLFAGFCAGALGVLFAALLTAFALAFSQEGFLVAAKALFLAHIPLSLAEGMLTACTLSFVARVRPGILDTPAL